jgi:hypothetical protein
MRRYSPRELASDRPFLSHRFVPVKTVRSSEYMFEGPERPEADESTDGNEGHYNDYAKLYSIETIPLLVIRPPVLFKPVQRAHSVFVGKKTPELIMEHVGFNGEF